MTDHAARSGRTGLGAWLSGRYLTADPRWLGIFRIGFGILLLFDGARRWMDVRAFYSNDGFLPNHYSLFAPLGKDIFSVFHAFSTVGEASVGFALVLFIYLMFTLGYRTRLFHILAAVAVTSLNARNTLVENGGTVVVNILCIWTLFLPLGARFSVDAVRKSLREHREGSDTELNDRGLGAGTTVPFVSLVVLALMLQWSVIYFFNTVHKNGVGWREGTALHYFLYQDRIVTWFAIWQREHVPFAVLRGLTYFTLAVEGTLAFILLIPFAQTWMRRVALLLAFGLHGMIAANARLGPFSYVMVLFFLLLLGPRDFALLERWFGRPARARTVVYDADCGVCLAVARLLKRLDPFARLTFVANDREELPPGVTREASEASVLVVLPDGRVFGGARGLFELLRALPGGALLGVWLVLPGTGQLAEAAYRAFAARRHRVSAWLGLGVCGVAPAPGAGTPSAELAPPAPELATPTGDTARTAASEGETAAPATAEPTAAEPAGLAAAEAGGAEPGGAEPGSAAPAGLSGAGPAAPDAAEAPSAEPERAGRAAPGRAARARAARARRAEPGPPRTLAEDLEGFRTFTREGLVAILLVVSATQVVVDNPFARRYAKVKQPQWMSSIVHAPRIFQGWGMFAPEPPFDDGRVVVDGRTADGRKLDPFTGQAPEFDPWTDTGWGHDQFTCDYHNRIRFDGSKHLRQWLEKWLLNWHEYAGRPGDRLVAFEVWWVSDRSPRPGEQRGRPNPPQKLHAYGVVKDSGATPWLTGGRAP